MMGGGAERVSGGSDAHGESEEDGKGETRELDHKLRPDWFYRLKIRYCKYWEIQARKSDGRIGLKVEVHEGFTLNR